MHQRQLAEDKSQYSLRFNNVYAIIAASREDHCFEVPSA